MERPGRKLSRDDFRIRLRIRLVNLRHHSHEPPVVGMWARLMFSVFYRSLALDQGRCSFVAKALSPSDVTVQFALVSGPSVHPRL